MAKSGTITPETGADQSIVDAVEKPSPAIMTLGAVAGLALTASSNPEVLLIDLQNRRVSVYITNTAEVSTAVEGATKREEFVQDVAGRVAQWTASKGSPLAPIANQAEKLARSMPALVGAIEDFVAAHPSEAATHIWVDQVTGKVSVFDAAGEVSVLGGISVATPMAVFDQTVSATVGTIKNAFQ